MADEPPDLASRALRGSVLAASDEFFAEKENLIKPSAPVFTPATFGHKGQVYDGWETRRRRDGGSHDWVIVRLGAPGVLRSVVVDTAFFTGNFPAACSLDASSGTGDWTEIAGRMPLAADTATAVPITSERRFSHVRLNIYPDGGVARLRVHGVVVPDPAFLRDLTVDLAALLSGGDVIDCSDRFYSAPRNALSPGLSRAMGDGWETRRRRRPGHEWLVVRLCGEGVLRLAEIDTSGYLGNAPRSASLDGRRDGGDWFPLLSDTPLLPDTPHRYLLTSAEPVRDVRLNIVPDGGVARLRLHGTLTPGGIAAIERRWRETGQ